MEIVNTILTKVNGLKGVKNKLLKFNFNAPEKLQDGEFAYVNYDNIVKNLYEDERVRPIFAMLKEEKQKSLNEDRSADDKNVAYDVHVYAIIDRALARFEKTQDGKSLSQDEMDLLRHVLRQNEAMPYDPKIIKKREQSISELRDQMIAVIGEDAKRILVEADIPSLAALIQRLPMCDSPGEGLTKGYNEFYVKDDAAQIYRVFNLIKDQTDVTSDAIVTKVHLIMEIPVDWIVGENAYLRNRLDDNEKKFTKSLMSIGKSER